jgi:hypothetical protein
VLEVGGWWPSIQPDRSKVPLMQIAILKMSGWRHTLANALNPPSDAPAVKISMSGVSQSSRIHGTTSRWT